MHDMRERVHRFAIDEHVQTDQIRSLKAGEIVFEGGKATRHRLQPVEEVQHDLRQRQLEVHGHGVAHVVHVLLHAAFFHAQLQHRPHEFLRHEDARMNDRFADFVDLAQAGQRLRIADGLQIAAGGEHFVDHRRRGGDQVQPVFALQTLLHDLHVQHAQKADTKTKAQGRGCFRLVVERGVVQAQLGQRIAKIFVVVRVDGEHACEHARLHLLEARHAFGTGIVGMGERIAHRCAVDILDAGNHIAHFADFQCVQRLLLGRENADIVDLVLARGRHHLHAIALGQATVTNAYQRDHAQVVVEPGIHDQRLQRRLGVAFRRRYPSDDGFQDVGNAFAGLGRTQQPLGGIDTDDVLDLLGHAIGIGRRQIDLVEHGQHFEILLDRGIGIGHALGFDTLGGIHHQQRPLAGKQRTRDFVGEIHVPRRIDEIEGIGFAVGGLVIERDRLGLDGNTTLAFEIHRIEHLFGHLTFGQPAACLDETIRQRRLAVVDMGDDGKIAYA